MEFLNGTFYAASTFLFLIRLTNNRKILLLFLARFDLANRNVVVKSKKGKKKSKSKKAKYLVFWSLEKNSENKFTLSNLGICKTTCCTIFIISKHSHIIIYPYQHLYLFKSFCKCVPYSLKLVVLYKDIFYIFI